jgi:putative endonuclease
MAVFHDTLGWLYVLCFDRPLGNPDNARALASHYLGFCIDLPNQLTTHAAGRGSSLTAAAVAQGITWTVYYRPNTPKLKHWLKSHYKHTPMLCPHCAGSRGRRPAYDFQPLDQLALPLGADDALPDVAPGKMDWFEIKQLRGWRATMTGGLPIAGLDASDVDIPF